MNITPQLDSVSRFQAESLGYRSRGHRPRLTIAQLHLPCKGNPKRELNQVGCPFRARRFFPFIPRAMPSVTMVEAYGLTSWPLFLKKNRAALYPAIPCTPPPGGVEAEQIKRFLSGV
jgi:hypothetical protein